MEPCSKSNCCRGGITQIVSMLGYRNGLFYGSAYVALGMYVARKQYKNNSVKKLLTGFMLSLACLGIESVICIMFLHASTTILWISVLPATYFLLRLTLNISVNVKKSTAIFLRKLSTLIYLSQYLYIELLIRFNMENNMLLFLTVVGLSILFGSAVLALSNKAKILAKLY